MIHRIRNALAAAVVAAAMLSPGSARAEDPSATTTLAQTLFEEGRRLMEQTRYAEACPKLGESHRLRPGTGTLLNLALCNEALGKTATAWTHFKEVLFAAKKENNEAREAFAQEHIAALEPKLSKLQVNAESTPGLVIRSDGQEIPSAALGTPVPVDPGEHEIEATAPGFAVWATKVHVGESADLKQVQVPKLTPAPAANAAAPQPLAPSPAEKSTSLRTAGFVIGGAGVAALGVGAVFGLLAMGQADDAASSPSLCPEKQCSKAGRDEIDGAETKALVSTIGFGVGIAAIGAGAVLVLTSRPGPTSGAKDAALPPRRAAAGPTARFVPLLGGGGGGVGIVGAF